MLSWNCQSLGSRQLMLDMQHLGGHLLPPGETKSPKTELSVGPWRKLAPQEVWARQPRPADTSPLSAAYGCLCSQLLSLQQNKWFGLIWLAGEQLLLPLHCLESCCSASNHRTSTHFLYKEQTIFPWSSPLIVTKGVEWNSEWNIGFNQDFIVLFQKKKKDSC